MRARAAAATLALGAMLVGCGSPGVLGEPPRSTPPVEVPAMTSTPTEATPPGASSAPATAPTQTIPTVAPAEPRPSADTWQPPSAEHIRVREVDGAWYSIVETESGSASLLVPFAWTAEVTSRWVGMARVNEVRVLDERGDLALVYVDGPEAEVPGTALPETWDAGPSRSGEHGAIAVAWSYPSTYMGSPSREHGVSIAAADGAPAGRVCDGGFCRSVIGQEASWYAGRATAESWFESDRVQTMLFVAASLEPIHGDPSR